MYKWECEGSLLSPIDTNLILDKQGCALLPLSIKRFLVVAHYVSVSRVRVRLILAPIHRSKEGVINSLVLSSHIEYSSNKGIEYSSISRNPLPLLPHPPPWGKD